MSRVSKEHKIYEPSRPKKVRVSGRFVGARIALVAVLVLIAVGAFTYGITSLFSAEKGWQEISADSTADTNVSSGFTFMYNIGQDGSSPTVQKKALVKLYTQAMVSEYKAYDTDASQMENDGTANIYDLNHHLNETLSVSAELYAALQKIKTSGLRNLYLGPVYAYYDDIFMVTDESQTFDFDPYQNEEIAAYYQEIADYANDDTKISLEFPGENEVQLNVSDDYLAYAKENGIENFIDFFWMKNAFILDDTAEALIAAGYPDGTISSSDGFVRTLSETDLQEYKLYSREGSEISFAGSMQFSREISLVSLRNFPLPNDETGFYQEAADGEIRTPYLDTADGKCKSSAGSMVCYAYDGNKSCKDILLAMIPVYIADESADLQIGEISEMKTRDIYTVYMKDGEVISNDESMEITEK